MKRPTAETLGLVETRTVVQGVRLMDRMLKAAPVELLRGASICSGRYMIQVAGLQADVEEALSEAKGTDPAPVDVRILPRVSPEVITALKKRLPLPEGAALGMVESRKAVSGIAAADAAVKKAAVILARLAVANGINGKSYLVVGGSVSAVEEAVEAAAITLGKELLDRLVLPNPDPGTVRALCPPGSLVSDRNTGSLVSDRTAGLKEI
ncbi:MAG: BMC domain-containing protein [Desulfobacterales bacterium]|nr:BMC domain-containing protein [Desulfobacterales bacterium]